jgi:protein arginine kinase activator
MRPAPLTNTQFFCYLGGNKVFNKYGCFDGVPAGRHQGPEELTVQKNFMQCCICKEKPATVHLTQIVDDKMQKLDLCEDCAKAKGVNDPTSFAMADLMLGLGASQELESGSPGLELKCPRCGFSQADFKKSGRLGCPDCYRTFAEGLAGLLKTMHKGTRHVGKTPEALRATRENVDRLKQLQKRLSKAVEEENYEAAAALRDEIKLLGGATAKTR